MLMLNLLPFFILTFVKDKEVGLLLLVFVFIALYILVKVALLKVKDNIKVKKLIVIAFIVILI
jgi:hypothetical protein